ncbi:TonB-dependent receptor [Sphingopyxis indica]|uniref:TonB-dependent receptor domain-containing protein n=1 Tax=Sphingopyxis indica TaxID=436663 RepID=UPI002938EE2A|nr:TonB-dependent receptor [Sphingopyxis indica]WOF44421.1 TonB-dependent receptor [Sphingopyxis indica]
MKPSHMLLFAGSALSLFVAAAPAGAQASDEPATRADDEIIVSGSRIQRSGFDAPTPTTVIGEAELRQGNRPSIGEVLNDMPSFRGTQTPATSTGNTSSGTAQADLRSLGASRTLTLLNGHRFNGAADLNTVPQALIERVDVVTGGASAAWGSGAVAGVVNIILKDDLTGLQGGIDGGISSRGDAQRYGANLAWGTDFADSRGHFMIGADFLQDKGAFDRKSRPNMEGGIFPRADGQLVLTRDVNYTIINNGGSILALTAAPYNLVFNPDGSVGPFPLGSETAGQFTVGGGGQNIYDYVAVTSPYKRANVFARASYEFSDAATLWVQGSYNRMWSDFGFFPETPIVVISQDNAFLTPTARDQLADAGVTYPFILGRILDDVGPTHYLGYHYVRRNLEGAIGLDGDLGGGWSYNAYYDHGELRNNQSLYNQRIPARFNSAVDSVLVSGVPTCRINADADPANDDAACVAINLFGNGNISPEAIDYAFGAGQAITTSKLDAAGASIQGQAFSTWAGPVDVAFGTDFRWEKYTTNYVDPLSEAGALATLNYSATNGKFDVKEVFGEINVPLLDIEGAAKLEVNGAARYSDYSTSGGIWSWKTGSTLRLVDDLLLRAVYSRDIRSPSISEYFTSRGTNIGNVADPYRGNAVQANVVSYVGGNPDLTPEVSHTLTLGGSYSPGFAPGLQLSVDYYEIEITNVIVTLLAQDVLNTCYAATPGDPTCGGLIVRAGDGSIASISRTYRNLAEYKTRGLDIEASYRKQVGPGTLSLRALATHVFELLIDDGVQTTDRAGIVGGETAFGTPKWRVTGSVSYQTGDFGVDLRARYVDGGIYSTQIGPNGQPIENNDIASRTYIDLGLQFKATEDFTFFANVNNLFDRDPPLIVYNNPNYDQIGRYFSIGAKAKF